MTQLIDKSVKQKPETVDYASMPDEHGHFGIYGGVFASETLMQALDELRDAYEKIKTDDEFQRQFDEDLAQYVGRPSPLYFAKRLSQQVGGAQIYLKREDLNHTGAHKINNALGQVLLAKKLGKKRTSGWAEPACNVPYLRQMCYVHQRTP